MIQAESRKHTRIKCRVIVERAGPTIDISAGGVSVLMANPVSQGAEVRLAFHLPEAERAVQCHGRVVHVSSCTIDPALHEVGIQFMRIMARDRKAIADYVCNRADVAAWAPGG